MLLRLLPPPACATTAAAPASVAFLPPTYSRSRPRCSHLPSAFPRLRKYGRRTREPVAVPSLDDEEETESESEYDDDEDEEMEVDEEEFLATGPKPMGFGEGKTYATYIEEQLLREMGLGGAPRKGDTAPAKRREGNSSATETDLNDTGVQVRVWNLPKKKNIHKDLKQAFQGFPGLLSIDPAVSGSKKTRDPICKGFAYLKLESADAATRFIDIYSRKPVAFGKVQKPISCCIVDGSSSAEPSNKASHANSQPRLKQQNSVAAS